MALEKEKIFLGVWDVLGGKNGSIYNANQYSLQGTLVDSLRFLKKKNFVKLGRYKVFKAFQKTGIIEPIVKFSLGYFFYLKHLVTQCKKWEENYILTGWKLYLNISFKKYDLFKKVSD